MYFNCSTHIRTATPTASLGQSPKFSVAGAVLSTFPQQYSVAPQCKIKNKIETGLFFDMKCQTYEMTLLVAMCLRNVCWSASVLFAVDDAGAVAGLTCFAHNSGNQLEFAYIYNDQGFRLLGFESKSMVDSKKMNDRISIPEFFTGRDIFITGGSGFLGKALVEKLLRSCSTLNRIYVLIRGKKGKTAEARIKEILESEFFSQVREKNDLLLNKVTAIDGDVMLSGLGISTANQQLLKDVSIVIHSAASVKFDDPLKEAILMNARGTLETLKLAENFPKIKAFIHISTTYSNPDKHVVEEELYPASVDWRTAIELAENYSTEMLNIFNLKYSGFQPNTYTFTKGLAEQIVNAYKHKLPVLIYRPSIVVSSVEEPVPGWIDNFNGPVGMFLASGIGILRTAHGDPNVCLDYMPVDVAVKALIVAIYKKCIENHNPQELIVYNCSTATIRPVSTGEIIEMARVMIKEDPMEQTFWLPGGGITRYKYWFYLRFITLHVFFAILADTILRISNNKPFFLKLQRKIYAANNALHYFNITQWSFQNSKFYELDNYILPSDRNNFAFEHFTNIDIQEFFRNALVGAKYFLLKMPLKSTKWAKIKFRILTVVNFLIQLTFGIFVLKIVISRMFPTMNST